MTEKQLIALAQSERDALVLYFESLKNYPAVDMGVKKVVLPHLFVSTNIDRIKHNMYPSKVFNASMRGLKEYKSAIEKL